MPVALAASAWRKSPENLAISDKGSREQRENRIPAGVMTTCCVDPFLQTLQVPIWVSSCYSGWSPSIRLRSQSAGIAGMNHCNLKAEKETLAPAEAEAKARALKAKKGDHSHREKGDPGWAWEPEWQGASMLPLWEHPGSSGCHGHSSPVTSLLLWVWEPSSPRPLPTLVHKSLPQAPPTPTHRAFLGTAPHLWPEPSLEFSMERLTTPKSKGCCPLPPVYTTEQRTDELIQLECNGVISAHCSLHLPGSRFLLQFGNERLPWKASPTELSSQGVKSKKSSSQKEIGKIASQGIELIEKSKMYSNAKYLKYSQKRKKEL
ncbi:hypothetical protein AAY473_003888 [Plecturocebus cupreus]